MIHFTFSRERLAPTIILAEIMKTRAAPCDREDMGSSAFECVFRNPPERAPAGEQIESRSSRRMVTRQHTRRKAPVHSFVWKVVAHLSRATVAQGIVASDESPRGCTNTGRTAKRCVPGNTEAVKADPWQTTLPVSPAANYTKSWNRITTLGLWMRFG